MTDKPPEAIWRPLSGLPDNAENWAMPGHAELIEEQRELTQLITDRNTDRTILDILLRERHRAFAIETGQIENLYTLKRGVTEQLITEGFDNVVGSHTLENTEDKTIKGLLEDQQAALEMIFDDIKDEKPLTHYTIKSWHLLLTRHQETVTGLRIVNNRVERVQVPFERKGQYKLHPNNPKRNDGVVHEYCPPEHVQAEMDRFFELYEDIRKQNLPTNVEAAWLHHRFVRTHPFQDGNGRVSRQLMAYAYIKRGEPVPIITAQDKPNYIRSLENADKGNLKAFSDYLGDLGNTQLRSWNLSMTDALEGRQHIRHANGGATYNGKYTPPRDGDYDPWD